jgi:hypothetical protein
MGMIDFEIRRIIRMETETAPRSSVLWQIILDEGVGERAKQVVLHRGS